MGQQQLLTILLSQFLLQSFVYNCVRKCQSDGKLTIIMEKVIDAQNKEILQPEPSAPKKQEEEDDSESYFMPVLNIRTKDERKEVEIDSPPILSNPPELEQKLMTPASLEKEDQLEQSVKKKLKLRKKADTNKAQKKQKTKGIKRPKGRPKKQLKIQGKIEKVSKRVYTKRQTKVKKQKQRQTLLQGQNLQQKKIPKKTKTQAQQQANKKQKQSSLSKYIVQTQKVQSQHLGNFETPLPKPKKQHPIQAKAPHPSSRIQSSSSSDSQSDSKPHRSNNSRSSKTKKIKLRLTSDQKLFIWKTRYARVHRRLKQLHFRCRKCPRQHYMRNLLHDADQSQARLACQKCSQLLVNVCLVYWQCTGCRHLVCGRCEGYDWMRCPYGHPLQRSEHYRGQKTCDVCLQRRYVGGVTCSCNFDMCGECVQRGRRQGEGRTETVSLDSSS